MHFCWFRLKQSPVFSSPIVCRKFWSCLTLILWTNEDEQPTSFSSPFSQYLHHSLEHNSVVRLIGRCCQHSLKACTSAGLSEPLWEERWLAGATGPNIVGGASALDSSSTWMTAVSSAPLFGVWGPEKLVILWYFFVWQLNGAFH